MGGQFELLNAQRRRADDQYPAEKSGLTTAAVLQRAIATSRQTARASIASPRPTGPIFSAVFALTLTWSSATASASASRCAHRRQVRREFRRLRDDGGVDIADLPAGAADPARRFGEQRDRIGALEALVGIGEMLADIAKRGGTEQRIGDRMTQRIGVGMTEQAVAVRNLHAAEDQRPPGDQCMGIPAFADAQARHGCCRAAHRRLPSRRCAIAKSAL